MRPLPIPGASNYATSPTQDIFDLARMRGGPVASSAVDMSAFMPSSIPRGTRINPAIPSTGTSAKTSLTRQAILAKTHPSMPSINLDGITHPMREQSEKMMAGKMFGGRAYGRAGMHAPGLLGAAIGFGTAGYYGGNQDGQSVAAGVAGGFLGGKMANWGQSQLHSAARSMIRTEMHSAEKMSGAAFKAVNIGKMMTHSSNRGMIFAAGGLLGGALFSKMFAGNGSTYKRGLNAHRGNSIER